MWLSPSLRACESGRLMTNLNLRHENLETVQASLSLRAGKSRILILEVPDSEKDSASHLSDVLGVRASVGWLFLSLNVCVFVYASTCLAGVCRGQRTASGVLPIGQTCTIMPRFLTWVLKILVLARH